MQLVPFVTPKQNLTQKLSLNLEKVTHRTPSAFIIKSFLPGFTVEKKAATLHLITSRTLCFNLLKRLLMQDSFIQEVFCQIMMFLKQRAKYLSCCRLQLLTKQPLLCLQKGDCERKVQGNLYSAKSTPYACKT